MAVEIAASAFRAGPPNPGSFDFALDWGFRRGRQAFSRAGGQETDRSRSRGAELASWVEEISSCSPLQT